ncbi:putative nucleoside hydrolase [Paratrimastix pyriformis]|uniref:Nucleoside hydrolase n=1 Tax=Paratrimastix pyriformis TaxID=342808 RepID=A0ABQ8UVH1_9EUKA|nr:putative nucleoside hydrolase [Paratrimastix pyriformis]
MSAPQETDVIIDTDVGADDAQAVALALYATTVPAYQFHLSAITTVHGNVSCDQATENLAKLLDYFHRTDIPFYKGASTPLDGGSPLSAEYAHGKSGLGDACTTHLTTPPTVSARAGSAHQALVDMIMARPNHYTLVTLGPLTNVALALRSEPRLAQAVKQLVVIGGAPSGRGNITTVAEFNVMGDPEAAREVFAAMTAECCTLVSWDLILDTAVPFSWMDAAWLSQPTPCGTLMRSISRVHCELYRTQSPWAWGRTGYPFGDPLAVLLLLRPDAVRRQRAVRLGVETRGELTRGMTVMECRLVDRLAPMAREHCPGVCQLPRENVMVVEELDRAVVQQVMLNLDFPFFRGGVLNYAGYYIMSSTRVSLVIVFRKTIKIEGKKNYWQEQSSRGGY